MQSQLDLESLELADILRGSNRTVVLTGAGISTESGIPDFRTPGSGLWTRVNPIEILSVTAMRKDPKRFYDFKITLWRSFLAAEPNAAHKALADLENMGAIQCVITQNIDSLHHRAGSRHVLEVHGHMRTGRCQKCSRRFPFETLAAQVEAGDCPPHCDCGGVLRPDVVLFEDMLTDDFEKAVQESFSADLMLVVGSSLEVSPANTLPQYARRVAVLNVGPTQMDRGACWRSCSKAGELLPLVVERLNAKAGG
ncbi:MAG TPA: NAD-dependent deacylase [Armatimonadota bacterium]|jgi:NAD-dependent deacetylase